MKIVLSPWLVAAVGLFLGGLPASALEQVYEKPSAFLERHFGSIPKAGVLKLDARHQSALKRVLGHDYAQSQLRYWGDGKRSAWILEEIGKTEPITVGILIDKGKIADLSVLVYRESHGWEVSKTFFTGQFKGAKLADGYTLDRPIDGIVGATLSVRALTKLSTAALYLETQVP